MYILPTILKRENKAKGEQHQRNTRLTPALSLSRADVSTSWLFCWLFFLFFFCCACPFHCSNHRFVLLVLLVLLLLVPLQLFGFQLRLTKFAPCNCTSKSVISSSRRGARKEKNKKRKGITKEKERQEGSCLSLNAATTNQRKQLAEDKHATSCVFLVRPGRIKIPKIPSVAADE